MKEEEKLLYGFGEIQNIVFVQQISKKEMRLYVRDNFRITYVDRSFYPFFFASSREIFPQVDNKLMQNFEGKIWIKKLSGEGFYNYIFAFETWSDMYKALRIISKKLSYSHFDPARINEVYLIMDPVSQFLIQSGETLFKGMNYEDLNILYINTISVIENKYGFHSKYFDQVFAFLISDNKGWSTVIYQKPKELKESDLLKKFVEIIIEKDPDIIVGYDIIEELSYLNSRYKLYNIPFAIGRDKSEPLFNSDNRNSSIDYRTSTEMVISGRYIVDLLHIILRSRSIYRDIEDFSLKSVAKYFDISLLENLNFEVEKIPFYADRDPQKLIQKIQIENQTIILLSDSILPQYFYQAQFIPMSFSSVINSGMSTKIEYLMIREYLRKRYSLPKPEPRTQIIGGYTDIFYRGLFENIIYADIESLYPSIIIQNEIMPASDRLNVFFKLVKILTKKRLQLKRLMEKVKEVKEKMHYNTMQNAYKVLINSFYGYLGFYKGLFNDFNKANEVTIKGQELLKKLIKEFQARNCIVIEVDTDGLYVSPQKNLSEEEERNLVEDVNTTLPDLINLSFSGRYAKMLSYKKKNYALLTYDNKIIIRGSALISKSFEPFALNFLQQCIELILTNKIELIPNLYNELKNDILNLNIDIKDLAKTEILRDSYQTYQEAVSNQLRAKNAAYELAFKYYGEKFSPGLKISYYITGEDPNVKVVDNCELIEFYNPRVPNVNRFYYIKKLEDYVSRFEVFFTKEDFNTLFPKEFNLNFKIEPKIINTIIKE